MAPTSSISLLWTCLVERIVIFCACWAYYSPRLCTFRVGLIASAGTSSTPADIELVKGLVTEYAKNESCIILLTVTCESKCAQ